MMRDDEDTSRVHSPRAIQLLTLSTITGCTKRATNANGLPTAIPQ